MIIAIVIIITIIVIVIVIVVAIVIAIAIAISSLSCLVKNVFEGVDEAAVGLINYCSTSALKIITY